MKEYVINSMENFRGWMSYITFLKNGKCPYTGKTKEEYLAEGKSVVDENTFQRMMDVYEDSLCNDWQEITEEFYNDQLNVLPPLKWSAKGFFISEATSGLLHDFYQELDGKFYTSLQKITKPRREIINRLTKAIADGKVKPIKEA